MSFSAAHDLKEQVRQATDIVDLLGSYMELQRKGRVFVARCPFHDDTRPSLEVHPDRQAWKCWPCNVGGDIFSFIMLREGLDFTGALRLLADRAGIAWQTNTGHKQVVPGSPNDKTTLFQAMAWAETLYHRYLLEGAEAAPAREYLASRQINADSIARYRIGYAPNDWQWLLDRARTSSQFTPDVLEAVGLVSRTQQNHLYDFFKGRVLFPIRDPQKRPIGFGGRILPQFADDRAAKYVNPRETRLYTKSEQLYGLDVVRDQVQKRRHVLVMEGYTDVILCRQSGIDNVVAVCGTALTEQHMRLLRRYVDRITLVLDGDAAGQKRAAEVMELFVSSPLELRIVTLPDNLDPCDFVLKHGREDLIQAVRLAPEALDFHVQKLTLGIDLLNDTHRATQALHHILTTVSRVPRDADPMLKLREQQTLNRLSRMFRMDEQILRQQIQSIRSKRTTPATVSVPIAPNASVRPPLTLDSWDRELFKHLIRQPEAIAAVIEHIGTHDMQTPTGQTLLALYQEIEAAGQLPDYQQVMHTLEDPELKNILFELADESERMEADDVELQLRELLSAYAMRREKQERHKHVAQIQSGHLKEQEEIELLNRLLASKRNDSSR